MKKERHGLYGTHEYIVWAQMKQRCQNPRSIGYKWYGARGITVCERWQKFSAFIKDMGAAASKIHQLDRRDNDGNYCPENCRWLLPGLQGYNTSANRFVTYHGAIHCVAEWAKVLDVSPFVLYGRLRRGWSDDDTIAASVSSTYS